MPVARRFPSAPLQISPGMTHPPSRLCPSDIRHGVPYKFRASQILACSPRRAASYPLPVRQTSALPSASSRFPVAQNTLAVRLTLPLAGRVEDFHLQVSAPCRAHQRKAPQMRGFFISGMGELRRAWGRSSDIPCNRRSRRSGPSGTSRTWPPCIQRPDRRRRRPVLIF